MTRPHRSVAVPPFFKTLLRRIEDELDFLPDKPDETHENTLKALWAAAEGKPLTAGQAAGYEPGELDPAARKRLHAMLESRLEGTPLAHLTGRQDFMGLTLLSSPAALVPRRETELLGSTAVDKARDASDEPLIIDLCTGAGNLALALALHLPAARVFGSDLSEDAVELARENARFTGLDRVEFRCGDLRDPFAEADFNGRVDLVVCNPPYISSTRMEEMPVEIRAHEPRLAFDGGPFGVQFLRRLVAVVPDLLRPGGWLAMEVGLGQGPQVEKLLKRHDTFDRVEPVANRSGDIRVLCARRA